MTSSHIDLFCFVYAFWFWRQTVTRIFAPLSALLTVRSDWSIRYMIYSAHALRYFHFSLLAYASVVFSVTLCRYAEKKIAHGAIFGIMCMAYTLEFMASS